MSVENLTVPNNYQLYIDTLHVRNLAGITGSTGAAGAYISPLYTNAIDSPPAGPDDIIGIGDVYAGAIQIGNANCQNQFFGEIQLPTLTSGPYRIEDSKGDITISVCNYSGVFTTTNTPCLLRLRRIGNWVDLYFNALNFTVSGGATFNTSLNLSGIIPDGYRPSTTVYSLANVVSSSQYLAGIGYCDQTGNIAFGLTGEAGMTVSFQGGNYNVGVDTFCISYTIN